MVFQLNGRQDDDSKAWFKCSRQRPRKHEFSPFTPQKRVEIGGSSGRCPAILMCAREFKALKLGEMDSCPVKEQLDTHCNGHAAPHALLGSLR